ncbi:hypothetical protein AYO47_04300 [Planctomyces sp. SCGC AG-212-M04]|nr:hypothetical protein AYO47_04300 [Planctomyces sp. SCGC AG-212-M04]
MNLTGFTNLDPAIASTEIGAQEGAFNPRLATGFNGSLVDEPPHAFFGPGISQATRYNQANVSAAVTQPLTTGGAASVAYAPPTAYLYFPDGVSAGQFNPAYSADLVFRLNQPILRNAGPRRALTGIRVARARTSQTEWDVQSALNSQIRSLSEAYWNLFAARIRLQAIDSVIPLAKESVRLEKLRYEAEQVILADVARAEVAVEELVRARASSVLEFRRRNYELNQLMGLPPAESGEVVPVDIPVQELIPADPAQMSSVALSRNPDLAKLRKQLEIRSLQLYVAERDRLPDVNLLGQYRTSGLASNMGGALDQMGSFGFPTWTFGVTLEYPLGNWTARNRAQAAEMLLTRDQLILKTSEDRTSYNISKLIANLQAAWERHESAERQVQQSREWLRLSGIRYTNPLPTSRSGNWLLLALVDYQNAMRGYVDAVTAASETLADYNVALARLDEAQGISMDRWAIELTNGTENCPPTPAASNPQPTLASSKRPAAPEKKVEQAEYVPTTTRNKVDPAAWQGHSSYRYQRPSAPASR